MVERVGRIRFVFFASIALVACSAGSHGGSGAGSSGGSSSGTSASSGGGSGSGSGSGSGTSSGSGSGGSTSSSSGGGGPSSAPAPTAKGTPLGDPVTQSIDAAGGTVRSPDLGLDVVVPAGAFAAATEVSIQVITNPAPNGVGHAYRLSPEGATFSTPVTLTFHLSDAEAQAIDTTLVATQHADDIWYSAGALQRDPAGKTVSLTTTHFSDWTVAQTLTIAPIWKRMKTGVTVNYTPVILETNDVPFDPGDPDNELAPVPSPTPLARDIQYSNPVWAVNGAPGGTDVFGLITNTGQLVDSGAYTAPKTPPSPDTVTVSLSIQVGKRTVIGAAQAQIYSQETWSGISKITESDGSVVTAAFTFTEVSNTNGKIQLDVQSGQVTVKPVSPNGSGCTVTIMPDTYSMGPKEGLLQVTYDLDTGPDSPKVAGQGQSVFTSTYTLVCPSGTSSQALPVFANWWPAPAGGAPTPEVAWDGTADVTISSAYGNGVVTIGRQK